MFLSKLFKSKKQDSLDGAAAASTPSMSKSATQLENVFKSIASCVSGQTCLLIESDLTEKLFSDCPIVGQLVYKYLLLSSTNEEKGVGLAHFQTSLGELVDLPVSSQRLSEIYLQMFASDIDAISVNAAQTAFSTCHFVDWQIANKSVLPAASDTIDSLLQALTKNLFAHGDSSVSQSKWKNWCESSCPRLFHGLHWFICNHLTQSRVGAAAAAAAAAAADVSNLSLDDGPLLQHCKDGRSVAGPSTLWLLSCYLPVNFFPNVSTSPSNLVKIIDPSGWYVIYDSGSQGLSTNRFQHHVIGYRGVTLMLLKFDKFAFVAAIDGDWKESRQRWGGIQFSLIQLEPDFRVALTGPDQIYFNLTDRTVPKGIQFGKDRVILLKIDAELDKINYYGADYKLQTVEVWGCGGKAVRDAQLQQKAWEARDVSKHQNRKLVPEEWKNNADRQLLEMAGVKTDHAERSDI